MNCFKYFCTLQYSFTLLTDTKQKPSKLSLGVSNTTQSNVTTTEKPYIYDIPKHKRLVPAKDQRALSVLLCWLFFIHFSAWSRNCLSGWFYRIMPYFDKIHLLVILEVPKNQPKYTSIPQCLNLSTLVQRLYLRISRKNSNQFNSSLKVVCSRVHSYKYITWIQNCYSL